MPLDFTRGRGHRPNHPSRRPRTALSHPELSKVLTGTDALPDHTENAKCCPPVMDQVQTSECEGHTEAEFVYTQLGLQGTPLDFVPSPTDIYQGSNGLQRAADNLGVPVEQLPPLTDSGLEPAFATTWVADYGVVPMKPIPGQNSDADPATAANEVDPEVVARGATMLVRGAAAVELPAETRVDGLCRLLAAKKVMKVALYAGSYEFQNYGVNSLPMSAPVPNPGSDHAVLLVDYRTDENGKRIFKLLNHWSEQYGLGGYFEVDESFALTFTDIEAGDVSIATRAA